MDARLTDDYDTLLERLRAKHEIVQRTFKCGGVDLELWLVADSDTVLQALAAEAAAIGDDLSDTQPYWAEVWDAALPLCDRIADTDVAGQRVLDLGCGLGLTTAVLATGGAKVLAVDSMGDALEFCRVNTRQWQNQVDVARVDWRYDQLDERFATIIASDVLYDRDHWPFLADFWSRHLAEDGVVVVSEPGRRSADSLAEFLRSRDWYVSEETTKQAVGGDQHSRLFEISREKREPYWVTLPSD